MKARGRAAQRASCGVCVLQVQELQEEGWKVDEAPHVIVVGTKGAVFLSAQPPARKPPSDRWWMHGFNPVRGTGSILSVGS